MFASPLKYGSTAPSNTTSALGMLKPLTSGSWSPGSMSGTSTSVDQPASTRRSNDTLMYAPPTPKSWIGAVGDHGCAGAAPAPGAGATLGGAAAGTIASGVGAGAGGTAAADLTAGWAFSDSTTFP